MNKQRFALAALLILLVSSLLTAFPAEASNGVTESNLNYLTVAAPPEAPRNFRYIEATGHSIMGAVLRVYDRTGGETRHGKPLSELVRQKNRYVQYFERSVFEFWPEYAGSGQEVVILSLGKLAAEEGNIQSPTVTPFEGTPNRWYFPETGHSLNDPFLTFWRNNGEAESLGLPITEEITQIQLDGTRLTYQYFQNARLERVGDQSLPQDVKITNLGTTKAAKELKPTERNRIPRERFDAPRNVRIPSLMFHYARVVDAKKDPLGFGLSVTPDNYVKFLEWVEQNGYTTVTIAQILDYMKFGILLPEKPVNFRWDDGHDNNWFVYQEMKKRGMTATFYVVTQRLELTPQQWKQISDDGFEVAAHTRTHADLRASKDLRGEITGSKTDLETMIGRPVRTFAYPYGGFNANVQKITRESGFEMAVSTQGGYGWTLDSMFDQPVISVVGSDSVESFGDKITRASIVVTPQPTVAPSPAKPTTPKR